DVVPVRECRGDGLVAFGVGGAQVAQRLLRKNDAPPISVRRPVTFEHGHLVRGIQFFQEQSEVQPRRSAADRDDLHAGHSSSWSVRSTSTVRGSAYILFIR